MRMSLIQTALIVISVIPDLVLSIFGTITIEVSIDVNQNISC